ncbi:DUF255 domain-containing protein [Boseongicola aestuarii]|uniref:Thioredoxin domain-containing protein n=1 Tax=Boseongicola aestuarii TaxID=1470561 RepID=A0A238J6C9_9RHOB|nr:DUF255 domain-containing protein [Boseongicola aestuarii]SMX25695.1 hypothetical protein BOA8489_03839 [Boseongicola aestuarii]
MQIPLLFLIVLLTTSTLADAREANHLQGADSPYLLQHVDNPVDWYPWGPEALNMARDENKLIFVSVGYSSCHWCHVMEEESFESEAIAALLNEHFVSIKIDRESRPDLDEQFMVVTQVLAGGGGWPNSVFLTPEGDPFFAGGYFPPDVFEDVVMKVQEAWRDDPAFVSAEAAKVASVVSRALSQRVAARELTPEIAQLAVQGILEETDSFYGGYGVAPKFPREPLFLFLLDHAERTGEREALEAVTGMLDGMIKGGIHDHVGGGFHRYAIDPEWHVPHFEKMLYTQALTGRLLVRAWAITGEQHYRRAAERTFDYVLREMQSPEGGFFSAQDADSLSAAGERVEGAYYMWTPSDLASLEEDAALVRAVFQVEPDGDFERANVLNLVALPSEIAFDAGFAPSAFLTRLDGILGEMYQLRGNRPPPFLDEKVVVSWNAVMIETLAEAANRLKRPEYYRAADKATRFILEHMRSDEEFKRIWFNGSPGTPAQLPDYAGLGLALIALHDYAPSDHQSNYWLQEAAALADDLRIRFGPVDNGLRMTESLEGLGEFIPVDDTEIPSGNALALTLFTRLAHRAHLAHIEQDAFRLAGALSGLAADIPEQRGFAFKAIQELQEGATGPIRHVAKGAVRAEIRNNREAGEILIDIQIADGWHINAHEPLEDYFIATDFSVEAVPGVEIAYPDPAIKSLSFNDMPLALYEGHLQIVAKSADPADTASARRAVLTIQACNDEICLQPEKLVFALW